jgi:hypothetical protein
MSSPEGERQAETGGPAPLSPERFVNDMDELASYLTGRGLPFAAVGHYRWMARYLAAYFDDGPKRALAQLEVGVHLGPVGVTVPFGPGSRLPAGLVFAAAQVLTRAWQLARSLFVRLLMSAGHAALEYTRGNAVASAPLAAAIVIVFFAGDSWKILGQGFDWQFGALLGFFLVSSVLGLANVRHLTAKLPATDEDLDALTAFPARDELAQALAGLGCPVPAAPPLSLAGKANAALIYLGIVAANLLLIAFLVVAALVLIGAVRINAALTADLSGQPAKVLLPLPGGMVITQQLLSLALTLGGLAVVSFTFVTLPDRDARARFAASAVSSLRKVLVAVSVYQAARAHEAALTGVDSHPGANRDR